MKKIERATHPDAPVEVAYIKGANAMAGEWITLKTFSSYAAFQAWHHPAYHEIKQVDSKPALTIILVDVLRQGEPPAVAQGAAAASRAAVKVPAPVQVTEAPRERNKRGGSKVDIIAQLLLRPQGCTAEEVKTACFWPSVSMPAQAKAAGLKLRKEKVGKLITYFGSK